METFMSAYIDCLIAQAAKDQQAARNNPYLCHHYLRLAAASIKRANEIVKKIRPHLKEWKYLDLEQGE